MKAGKGKELNKCCFYCWNKIINTGWPLFILGFGKHLTLDIGRLLSVPLFFLCILASSALPKKSTHTHCQNKAVRSLSAEAHYSKPLLPAASVITLLFSPWAGTRGLDDGWTSAQQNRGRMVNIAQIWHKLLQNHFWVLVCVTACVESLPVVPVCREEALVGKLTRVFLTQWKTGSFVGGKIKVLFSRAFFQQVSSDSLGVFY